MENTQKKKPRWFYGYFALALFDLITVLASLYLNKSIIDIYNETAIKNTEWSIHQEHIAELSKLALITNAPGNDVFETKDAEGEQEKYRESYSKLVEKLKSVQEEFAAESHVELSRTLIDSLKKAEESLALLNDEVTTIFSQYASGNLSIAASHMSLMDRKYSDLATHLAYASEINRTIQKQFFDEQNRLAEKLKIFELAIGGFVLFMVVGATFYGTYLIKRINIEEENKARTELELRRYKEHLEDIVEAQTKDIVEAKEKAELANRAKSEFLSNMSHELRTPIHAILAFSRQGIERTKEKLTKEFFTDIQTSGNRLVRLLNNLLDLSKLEAGKTEMRISSVNMIDLINHSVKELDSLIMDKNIKLSIEHDNNIPHLDADKELLMQAIINLLSNAIKFTPIEKKISIKIISDKIQVDDDSVSKDLATVKVSVADEGVGIPGNELEKIFDKFVQSSKTKTGAGGTGLGLSICKEIINLHGGNIWAENKPTGGAIFTFILPTNKGTSNGTKN